MAKIQIREDGIFLSGDLTVTSLGGISLPSWPRGSKISVDASGIQDMDTAGALFVQRMLQSFEQQGSEAVIVGLGEKHAALLSLVARNLPATKITAAKTAFLHNLGVDACNALQKSRAMLSFLGETAYAMMRLVSEPGRIRFKPLLHNLQHAGFNALPICGLLAFLMGIVIAYQGAEQLQRYGANIFVVDLVGLSMLRELGPLLTAIIVAGRSGSAFTAQIGTMKVTDEIDALETIGIPPMEQLVLPKILALLIALPLLTVFADIMGVFGGMVMAAITLDVNYPDFLLRFENAIRLSALLVGVGKAPVFAGIVSIVGCFEGFRVEGGSDSVGRQTTQSVVLSIFLVIVADAVFSVIFSMMGI